jgi:hypothetical protein
VIKRHIAIPRYAFTVSGIAAQISLSPRAAIPETVLAKASVVNAHLVVYNI